MPILLDVEGMPDCCLDETLDTMAKAVAEGPAATIWDPLPNRFARWMVEDFTHRYQSILQQMQAALGRFLGGHADELRKADVPWLRWSEAHFEMVRARLESMDPARFTIEDWMLLVDYLIQRYLPEGVIQREADYLAVRSVMLGKIQLNLERDPRVTDRMADTLAALLPTEFTAVPPRVLTPLEIQVLTYGRAHAGEFIRHLTEDARHRMATICLEHVQGGLLGQKEGTWAYAKTRLFDDFSILNRDFRRIAVTESGEMLNQSYVAARGAGKRVKRQEAYRGACPFCQSINGMIFTIVDPAAPDKDGDTEIWVGKTNVGRSAAPRKREGNTLVEREPDELWWPAAGVQHPHCRGAWVPVTDIAPNVSPEFFSWMQATLDQASATFHATPG